MSEEEIEINHTKDSFCAKIPLITKQELRRIDDNLDSITDEITKQVIHDKDLAIEQHIIQKQKEKIFQLEEELQLSKFVHECDINRIYQLEQENNKQSKIIDEMTDSFYKLYQKIPGTMHKFFENGKPCEYGYDKETNDCKEINCKGCIKQYFEKKVGD